MKRRSFVRALMVTPAGMLAGQAAASVSPVPQQSPAPPAEAAPSNELPHLEMTAAEVAAEPLPHFFLPPQYSALFRLSDLLTPATDGPPSATAVNVPQFLDFMIGQSPSERQQIYRAGLDALNAASKQHYGKNFADV